MPDFTELVKEDAKSVQERQDTDTVAIIDDIPFHLTDFIQTYSDVYEADQKLAVIDAFLEELQLDAYCIVFLIDILYSDTQSYV